MHEYSLVKKEVNHLREKLNSKRVNRVFFSLGRLAHGTPQTIKEAFRIATIDTPLSGVKLEVLTVDPKVKCSFCGNIFGVDGEITFSCPQCGSTKNEVIAGKECHIEKVELEN
jgi:hydrogenase nickel incorporation protein HypA/HybF